MERQKAAQAANEQAQKELEKQEAQVIFEKLQNLFFLKNQTLNQLKVAEAEQSAAIADLKREEDEYNGKIKALEDKIANPSTSNMQKMKANNELAQLKGEGWGFWIFFLQNLFF